MKLTFNHLLLAGTAIALLFNSCSKNDSATPATAGTTVNAARQAALDDYTNNYLGSAISVTGWTGSTSTCTAGRCSQATSDAVLNRINYFRRMVGLNSHCSMDTSLYQQEQEAALMQSANSSLSHTPPTSWACYSSTGSSGCGSSNLALGYNSTNAITAFMSDDGSGNEATGHRRWILHSRKQRYSYGSTNNAMALYVFYTDTNTIVPSYVAYPPNGYMPQALVPSRWSFGIPSANLSAAIVTMTDASGTPIPVTLLPYAVGYGDNTLVWTATGINTTSATDVAYTIIVSGISGASATSFTYTSTIFKP